MANYNTLKNAAILNPTSNTDLGSATNKYSNIYLSGNIILGSTVVTSTNVITPKIASISYVGNDTATDIAGGQIVTLTGSGFSSGAGVLVNNVSAPSVTVVSSTLITFTAPAISAGTYVLYVVNTDGGTATFLSGISFSGTPTWTTSAGSLGNITAGASASISVAAAGDVAITYSVKSGSSLPSGLSLNSSTGAITGTAPTVASTTTYNFTLNASDAQNQDTDRAFSIVVVAPLSSVQLLVVAGGGGGGRSAYGYPTGGGGAGGYLSDAAAAITTGTAYTITIGAGGSVGPGTQGDNSSMSGSGFTTVTSVGGGYGGNNSTNSGGNGGSGGGGGGNNNHYPGGKGVYPGSSYLAQARQGYNGGSQTYTGGGGGGAGGAGSGSTYDTDPNAGPGLQWSDGNYYAGGGAAGAYPVGTAFAGGIGGGGAGEHGSATSNAVSGTVNTGGGGGGGGNAAAGGGGSGVVIIRYSDSFGAASSATGLAGGYPVVAGGYRTYKFTSSGSITF